jgi:hypothetical protein
MTEFSRRQSVQDRKDPDDRATDINTAPAKARKGIRMLLLKLLSEFLFQIRQRRVLLGE